MQLPEELVEFMESGVSLLVGSADANLRPDCARAVGCIVGKDRRSVWLLVNATTTARTLANLATRPAVAFTASRVIDHRTIQVKGQATATRSASEPEQMIAQRYIAAFTEALYQVGLQRAIARRLNAQPCMVIEMTIEAMFHQTPGPQAGEPVR